MSAPAWESKQFHGYEKFSKPPTPQTPTDIYLGSPDELALPPMPPTPVSPRDLPGHTCMKKRSSVTPDGGPQPPCPACERKLQKTKRILEEFGSETSIHGVPYWLDSARGPARYGFTRWLYLLLWLSLLGCCGFLIYTTFSSYFLYEVAVSVSRERQDEMPLPGLTICPATGDFKRSTFSGDKFFLHSLAQGMFESREELFRTCHQADGKVLFGNATRFAQRLASYHFKLEHFMGEVIAAKLGEMFLECSIGQKTVNCSDIFMRRFVAGSFCYTFNYNATVETGGKAFLYDYRKGPLVSSARGSGEMSGLSLLLHADDPEFCLTPALPLVGFRVLVHSINEAPTIMEPSVLAGPGQRTQIRVQETLFDRHKTRSIGRCSDDKRLDLFTDVPYSRDNCIVECLAFHIWKKCKCVTYVLPVNLASTAAYFNERHPIPVGERQTLPVPAFLEDTPLCWGNDVGSICGSQTLLDAYKDPSNSAFNCTRPQECPVPCVSRAYTWTSSSAGYPPENMMGNLLRKPSAARFPDAQAYRANVAALDVVLDSMEVEIVSETRAMGPSALFNNLGGSLGLFLGISLFSIVEVFTFACRIACRSK